MRTIAIIIVAVLVPLLGAAQGRRSSSSVKQVVPYARFLVRASMEKRRSGGDIPASTPPAAQGASL